MGRTINLNKNIILTITQKALLFNCAAYTFATSNKPAGGKPAGHVEKVAERPSSDHANIIRVRINCTCRQI
jgi:hypothetical protein